jgi:Arc/MetJ family transcription regulator
VKITTYVDDTLLKQALKETGARSQREVIEEGLRNLLADLHRKRFIKAFDSLRFNVSWKEIKRQRA